MKLANAVWLLILVMGFSQCNRCPSSQSPMLGRYEIVGHDTSGRLIFTGVISLISLEQNHLKGRCTIKWDKNASRGLPDEDSGCEGLIEGKVISIDSAPSIDDAGLILEGQFSDARITGIWWVDGFATTKPLGKFEAVQRK